MAALTEAQLQSACRAKFPITVVRDEDYTVLTPAQIADAWLAYSGGTDGVYLQNVAGTWAEMDPDLPKANDRGLLVFGGGKQYAQRCDFAGCTVGQAFPAGWSIGASGLTIVCSAKDEENGLPYVEATLSGTPNSVNSSISFPPGAVSIAHGEAAEGNYVIARWPVELVQKPAQITATNHYFYQVSASPGNAIGINWIVGELVTAECVLTDNAQTKDYQSVIGITQSNGVAYETAAIYRIFPPLFTVNTAFPSHFHCLNTSTTSAKTIVPEVMQRPWEYEGPWSVELEFVMPPRHIYGLLYSLGLSTTDRAFVYTSNGSIVAVSRVGNVSTNVFDVYPSAVPAGSTNKLVVYQTSQRTAYWLNGVEIGDISNGHALGGMEMLGHEVSGVASAFVTFKSLKRRKGLATDAQLEEWSTAA